MSDAGMQNSIFEERILENNNLLLDLFDQMKKYLPEETMSVIVNTFYAARYAVDTELISALRNAMGYLYASGVNDQTRITHFLVTAIIDSMNNILNCEKCTLDIVLLEKARHSKDSVVVPKESEE